MPVKRMGRVFKDIKKYMPYTILAAKYKLKSEIIDTYIGCLWWLLEPICYLFIYVFVFSHLLSKTEAYYPLLVFIGVLIWNFFSKSIKSSVNVIKRNSSLLDTVYIPKYMLLLQTMLVNAFKMLIGFAISFLMILYYKINLTINCFLIVPILLLLFLLTFGFSCIIMHFGVRIGDLDNAISIVIKIWFYLTGVFYSIPQRFPSPYSDILLMINPIAYVIEEIRNNIIYGKIVSWEAMIIWTATSIAISIIGVRTIYKKENSYLKVN